MSQARIGLVSLLLVFATLSAAQNSPRTVGELLSSGGSQLDQTSLRTLLSGATATGDFMQGLPGEKLELAYAADGTVKGYLGARTKPASGTWEVSDQGRLCSVLRDATNIEHRACTFWFQIGEVVYASSSNAPGSVIYLRRIYR